MKPTHSRSATKIGFTLVKSVAPGAPYLTVNGLSDNEKAIEYLELVQQKLKTIPTRLADNPPRLSFDQAYTAIVEESLNELQHTAGVQSTSPTSSAPPDKKTTVVAATTMIDDREPVRSPLGNSKLNLVVTPGGHHITFSFSQGQSENFAPVSDVILNMQSALEGEIKAGFIRGKFGSPPLIFKYDDGGITIILRPEHLEKWEEIKALCRVDIPKLYADPIKFEKIVSKPRSSPSR